MTEIREEANAERPPKLSSEEAWKRVGEKIEAEIRRRWYTAYYKKEVL